MRTSSRALMFCIEGPLNDGGWNEGGARAASALSSLDVPTVVTADFEPERFSEQTVVVGHGIAYAERMAEAAQRYPDTHFLVTDDPGALDRKDSENLSYIDWCWDEGAFLAGALAQRITHTGTVGILGGVACTTQKRALSGFHLGARMTYQHAHPICILSGSFSDVERGRRLGESMYNEGVDVLLHTADSCGMGAIRTIAAHEASTIGFLGESGAFPHTMVGQIYTDISGAIASLLASVDTDMPRIARFGIASGYQRFEIAPIVEPRHARHVVELQRDITNRTITTRSPADSP